MRRTARRGTGGPSLGRPALSAPPRTASLRNFRRPRGLHPLLFAAYPVLFLWSQNAGETSFGLVVGPLLVVLVATALALGLTVLVVRDAARAALIVTSLLAGLLLYGHVRELLVDLPIRVRYQQIGWIALAAVGILLALRLSDARIRRVDSALTGVGGLLVLVALISIVPSALGSGVAGGPRLAEDGQIATATDAPRRDVYWLVFDRYGSDRSIELAFGSSGSITPWLRENGFTVLDDSHANYGRTVLSMASTLNVTHLDGVAARMGRDSSDYTPVHEGIQRSLVARQFKSLGYTHHHIGSWWQPTATIRDADVNHNASGLSEFAAALYDTSALPVIARRLGLARDGRPADLRHYEHGRFGLDTLESVRSEPGPKFVVAHVLLPHGPYAFDRDGSFVSAAEARGRTVRDRWERQLAYTNGRLQRIIEDLLALPPDEQPIIILQADEGPYSAAYSAQGRDLDWSETPEEELEIKFGILNAWYLPGGADLALDPAMTAINTFPVLFSRYFGLDYELLPDRVYASRGWKRPYDLVDITDRLPSLR